MHIVYAKLGQADAGDNEAKLKTKLAPEWVRTSDPVIRSPARYRWTTAPAGNADEERLFSLCTKNKTNFQGSLYIFKLSIYLVTPHAINGIQTNQL